MPIEYTNRPGKVFYLQKTVNKKGVERFLFSQKSIGPLLDNIPNGYEIYEHPNNQVYLRKIPQKIITDKEKMIVEKGVQKYSDIPRFLVDIRKYEMVVHINNDDFSFLKSTFNDHFSVQRAESLLGHNYKEIMKLTLIDKKEREFKLERMCYRGMVDWIYVDKSSDLEGLTKKYFPHLGKESYYSLGMDHLYEFC